jgi:hypothetical protein
MEALPHIMELAPHGRIPFRLANNQQISLIAFFVKQEAKNRP